jgi:hypothetical protein
MLSVRGLLVAAGIVACNTAPREPVSLSGTWVCYESDTSRQGYSLSEGNRVVTGEAFQEIPGFRETWPVTGLNEYPTFSLTVDRGPGNAQTLSGEFVDRDRIRFTGSSEPCERRSGG